MLAKRPAESLANFRWVGPVPHELKELTWIEELLIARAHVRKREGGMSMDTDRAGHEIQQLRSHRQRCHPACPAWCVVDVDSELQYPFTYIPDRHFH